jgi:uncharacterized protein YkwD
MRRAILLLAALLAIAPAAAGAKGDPESALLAEVNAARAARGLRALAPQRVLARVARAHSAAMAKGGFFDHLAPDGTDAAARVAAAGYAFAVVGENIAAGMADPKSAVTSWLASPGHRRNLLDPRAMEAGAGYAPAPDGRYRHYWTILVAAPAPP